MKKILILSIDIDFKNSLNDLIKPFYEELSRTWIENNVQFYRSSVYEYNISSHSFKNYQKYDWNSWIECSDLVPDIIWYKSNTINYLTRKIEENYLFINNTKYIELANNKFITSRVFQDESPRTFIFNKDNLSLFNRNSEIIIKPDGGSGWYWVEKLLVSQIDDKRMKLSKWYIIQEVIDSSNGIEWVIEWIHDLRFFIFWNKIWDTVVLRTPPKNDFRCNISQWWNSKSLLRKDIPDDLNRFVEEILVRIKKEFWELFWSIDIVKANNRYYLIEFNSSPGVNLYPLSSQELKKYFEEIIYFFKSKLK